MIPPDSDLAVPIDPKIIPTFEKLKHLKNLSEDNFRDLVVRPLFLRQGMEHGSDTCGVDEGGKDCYLWSTDALGFKMLYVIQTKVGNVTMSKSPKLNLQEAITQLRTAMAATVPDIVSKKRIRPHVGIFCVSGKINDRAKRHIIDEVKEPNLRFLDADNLITQIDNLYPEYWQGIEAERFPYLNSLHEKLLNASDVISLATILPETETLSPITSEGFAPLRLMRTYLKPQKISGKVEQLPEIETISVNSLLLRSTNKILILGEAGSGKSTILRRLAEVLIERAKDTGAKLLIPVLLRAIDAAPVETSLAEVAMAETAKFSSSNTPAFGADHLNSGSVAVFVDALDEVASEALSSRILNKIEEFILAYPKCKIVLTSRQQSFLGNLDQLAAYEHFRVIPIGIKEASQIIKSSNRSQALSKDRSEEIIRHLETIHGMDLNPLLVTVFLASSDASRKDIPANITEIFAKFTEMMLGRWDTKKGLSQQYESSLKDLLLRKLAYGMHLARKTSISREECVEFFTTELESLGKKSAKIEVILDEILVRSNLFRVIDGKYEFRHLLLQEFFAGRGVPSHETLLSLLSDEWWRRAIIFYFGGKPQDSEGLLFLATTFQPTSSRDSFIAATTLGLAAQACYFVKVPEKRDIMKWVICTLADAHSASIAQANDEGISLPLHNFLFHYLVGRDSIASDVLIPTEPFEELWQNVGADRADLRKFWTIAGLIENGEMETVKNLLKTYNPKGKELFLAIHLGCFMVERMRVMSPETKKLARRIYIDISKHTMDLRKQLLKELKSELLELRQGRIVAIEDKSESVADI
jgi:energy-coupling factor transporter ATP-binding protein EcfA2